MARGTSLGDDGRRLLGAAPDRDERDMAHTRARVNRALFGAVADPQRVDRFALLARVGAGASGVVYAAYDPRLDRKVALKLIRVPDGPGAEERRRRWLREGQAMARLSHPNVLPVYDAGALGDELFLAMEFVDGGTLRGWLAREPRGAREVIEHFCAAGRGLAAAHAAGVVHRDFKPDNVLVGRDGRVRVADFGLSRSPGEGPAVSGANETGEPEATVEGPLHVTRTGAVLGTPAYMAPEQLRGEVATARSDQFSFCVALWEALYGARPFPQEDLPEALAAMDAGAVEPPPEAAAVPRPVRRALVRGLAADPSERHPSMGHLLEALTPPRAARRALWGGAGVGALVLAAAAEAWSGRPDPAQACRDAGERVTRAWGDPQRDRVVGAFAGVSAPFAASALAPTLGALDDYGARWRQVHDEACEATHERHEVSAAALDLRMACLDRNLAALTAAVDQLARADAEVAAHARDLVAALPDLDACMDAPRSLEPPASPPTAAQREVRRRVEGARARWRTGKAAEAVAEASTARGEALALEDPILQAEAGGVLGLAQADLGRGPDAEASLLRAVGIAEAARADELVARLWLALARLASEEQRDLERAGFFLARAESSVARVGSPLALRFDLERARAAEAMLGARYDRARADLDAAASLAAQLALSARARLELELSRAAVRGKLGDYGEAAALLDRASEDARSALGPDHPLLGDVYGARARLDLARGDLEAARGWARRAREQWAAAFGPEHPKLARALAWEARAEYQRGQYAPAAGGYDEAVAMLERTRGPRHADLVPLLRERGMVALRQGRYDDAARDLERARKLAADLLGPHHPDLASVEEGLGTLAMRRGDLDGALGHALRALEIRERALGPEHVHLAYSHNNVGDMLLRAGRVEEGARHLRRARDLFVRHLGPQHPMVAFALSNLGRAEHKLGQLSQARADLERALEIRRVAAVPAAARATTEFDLARVLADEGAEPARARDLARAARGRFAAEPETYGEILARIDRWLAARRD